MICTNKRQNQAIITSLVSSACLAALTFGFSEKASAAATVWGGNGAITSITDGGNYGYEGGRNGLNSSRLINGLTGNAANNNAYMSVRAGQSLPLEFTLNLDQSYILEDFVLWNDRGGSQNALGDGLREFSIAFYSEEDGSGTKIGDDFDGVAADSFSEQTFHFDSPYIGVQSVVLTMNNEYFLWTRRTT